MENKEYKLKDLPFSRQYFWSYSHAWDRVSLPLPLIMEQLIRYGRFKDHLNLFIYFPYDELRDTYFNKIRPVMSGEIKLRPDMIPTEMDLKNVKYMDYLFEVLKNVAA
ncbi:MAG: hypothetical protein M1407_01500 [Deltaproteobacteria bacterium]|nr:hypothetical protein [Deltaproteobacteria bacterium]